MWTCKDGETVGATRKGTRRQAPTARHALRGPRSRWDGTGGLRKREEAPVWTPLRALALLKRRATPRRPSAFSEEGYLRMIGAQLGALLLPARLESTTQKRKLKMSFVFTLGARHETAYTSPD